MVNFINGNGNGGAAATATNNSNGIMNVAENFNFDNDEDLDHEDLNIENIDILEDELRRSNHHNGGQFFANFNQIDSSIQRLGSGS